MRRRRRRDTGGGRPGEGGGREGAPPRFPAVKSRGGRKESFSSVRAAGREGGREKWVGGRGGAWPNDHFRLGMTAAEEEEGREWMEEEEEGL